MGQNILYIQGVEPGFRIGLYNNDSGQSNRGRLAITFLDEQGEYSKTYDHKPMDGRIYAVRGNWAFEKGLMNAGPNGYIDEVTRPKQDVGCMCWLQWVYSLRDLPDGMITPIGKAELARAKTMIARLLKKHIQR